MPACLDAKSRTTGGPLSASLLNLACQIGNDSATLLVRNPCQTAPATGDLQTQPFEASSRARNTIGSSTSVPLRPPACHNTAPFPASCVGRSPVGARRKRPVCVADDAHDGLRFVRRGWVLRPWGTRAPNGQDRSGLGSSFRRGFALNAFGVLGISVDQTKGRSQAKM